MKIENALLPVALGQGFGGLSRRPGLGGFRRFNLNRPVPVLPQNFNQRMLYTTEMSDDPEMPTAAEMDALEYDDDGFFSMIDARGLNTRFQPWKELDLDSNGDIFIVLGDNRDMITQLVDYALEAKGSSVMYDQIMEYGCHCNLLDDKLKQGVGEPVDAIDEACRDWRRCRACTRMDDTDCLPDTTPYTLWYDYQAYLGYCARNKKGCSRWTCQCDTKLAKTLADLSDEFNVSYSKAGGFKKSKQCHWKNQDWSPPDECCGRFPTRFPYSTDLGRRDCCGTQTFLTEKKCCVANKIKECPKKPVYGGR